MNEPIAWVTGAGGEIGRLLIPALSRLGFGVVALDLHPLPPQLTRDCVKTARLDITDRAALGRLFSDLPPSRIFHLAAVLSSHAERDPDLAHAVNVDATLELFRLCRRNRPVRFLFPSSIAVYGLPDARTKAAEGPLCEWQWNTPSGIYGCNKLYCEQVGSYLTRRAATDSEQPFDFRAIRFPGLISAETLPSGGTTDYAPQMIHAAAEGVPARCFVEAHTALPFMTMPDAVAALLGLAETDDALLSRRVYNVKGFSCTADQIRLEVLKHFPDADITFAPDLRKQAIVDSWPADVDDSRARRDWGLATRHGLAEALADYLVPALRNRYATPARQSNLAD